MAKKGNIPWNKGLNEEERTCTCGCGETFVVPKSSKKKFIDIQHFYKYNKGDNNSSRRPEVKDKIATKARARKYPPRSKEAIEKQRKSIKKYYDSMTFEERRIALRVDDPDVKKKVKANRVERVKVTCRYCGKEFKEREKYFEHDNRTFCSNKCRMDWMRETGGWAKGIPKSEEARKKISISKRKEIDALSEEGYYARFATRIGQSPTEETREKISKSLEAIKESRSIKAKEKWESFSKEEKRRRIYLAANALAGQRIHYRSPIAGDITLHSSYEKRLAKIFDSVNVDWERNDEPFPYKYEGRTHYYIPDFKVNHDGGDVYYETKGYFRKKDYAKIKGFRKLGHTLIVIGKEELDSFEVDIRNGKNPEI